MLRLGFPAKIVYRKFAVFSFRSLEKMKKISVFTRNFALIYFAKKESEVLCAINSCSYNTYGFEKLFFRKDFTKRLEISDKMLVFL